MFFWFFALRNYLKPGCQPSVAHAENKKKKAPIAPLLALFHTHVHTDSFLTLHCAGKGADSS